MYCIVLFLSIDKPQTADWVFVRGRTTDTRIEKNYLQNYSVKKKNRVCSQHTLSRSAYFLGRGLPVPERLTSCPFEFPGGQHL